MCNAGPVFPVAAAALCVADVGRTSVRMRSAPPGNREAASHAHNQLIKVLSVTVVPSGVNSACISREETNKVAHVRLMGLDWNL